VRTRARRPRAAPALLALAGLAGCADPPAAQPQGPGSPDHGQPTAVLDSLDVLAPLWLAAHDVPSVAVAYVDSGRVRWSRVYGEQAPGEPASEETLYNVASLTKPVFAEVVLRLTATGVIGLDSPLHTDWVDPDVAGDPRHRRLTYRLVLSHQTGFSNWRRDTGGVLRFIAEPGTKFGYSGEGFEYAARAVANRTGRSLESLARDLVLDPLGMNSTAFTRRPWFEGRVAVPQLISGRPGPAALRTASSAADDLYTTVGDYAAFVVAVMKGDGLPPGLVEQRDSIHVTDPTATCDLVGVARCPDRVGVGLGWWIHEYPDETVLMHTGSDAGEKTIAFYIPERRTGAVIFTNGAYGFRVYFDVIDLLFDKPDFVAVLRTQACREARAAGVDLQDCPADDRV
jgi:CubicO group peptidase (beta-lactamase class C family)